MINFDLSTAKPRDEFGEKGYRKGYSQIQQVFRANGFEHHQYSGYFSQEAMISAEVYDLVLSTMVTALPWLSACVEKFDATNVTSQSNMLAAIRSSASSPEVLFL
ncbi:MAG: hypothetical protein LBP28_02645 [Coriobacteriales bacterium]|jgi:virulence-associated protein VapD|nr:hypothetical protein [Coriobacteriales bacterium]